MACETHPQAQSSLEVPWPPVAIVLINYGQWQHTLRCLASLQHLDYPQHRVIVVDNASPDDSLAQLQNSPVPMQLIPAERNLGFAGGVNLGIQAALAHGAEMIWLLNNDTRCQPDTLSALVLEAQRTGGLVGSVLVSEDGKSTHVGTRFNWWTARPHSIGLAQYTQSPRLDAVCGGSMLIPKPVIEAIGLLDERYFLYLEDCEYALRAKQAGFPVTVALDSRVIHTGGATTQTIPGLAQYYSHRNRMLLIDAYATGLQRWVAYKYTGWRLLRTAIKAMTNPLAYQTDYQAQRHALQDWRQGRFGPALHLHPR